MQGKEKPGHAQSMYPTPPSRATPEKVRLFLANIFHRVKESMDTGIICFSSTINTMATVIIISNRTFIMFFSDCQ